MTMEKARLLSAPVATSSEHAGLLQAALNRSARKATCVIAGGLATLLAATLAAALIDWSMSGLEPRNAEASVVARPISTPSPKPRAKQKDAPVDNDVYAQWESRNEHR
jgi:hypothetical protein